MHTKQGSCASCLSSYAGWSNVTSYTGKFLQAFDPGFGFFIIVYVPVLTLSFRSPTVLSWSAIPDPGLVLMRSQVVTLFLSHGFLSCFAVQRVPCSLVWKSIHTVAYIQGFIGKLWEKGTSQKVELWTISNHQFLAWESALWISRLRAMNAWSLITPYPLVKTQKCQKWSPCCKITMLKPLASHYSCEDEQHKDSKA